MNVDVAEKLRHLSLCSGYDGIGLGIERAGFPIGFTVHVEIETFASYNLVKKIEAGALGAGVHYPDLKTFPFRKFRGCIDLLSGGFPCQPFSQAGKGNGTEDPRHLFPYIKEGIAACRPAIVFLENVEGIVSSKTLDELPRYADYAKDAGRRLGGDWGRTMHRALNKKYGTPVLLHVIRELERVGYRATAVPSSASEVGAPHQRNRWFIVGVLADGEGLEGYDGLLSRCDEPRRQSEESERSSCRSDSGGTLWPARPGEEQFGWEPPRVVGNAKSNNERRMPESSMHGEGVEAGGSSGNGSGELGNTNDDGRHRRKLGLHSEGRCGVGIQKDGERSERSDGRQTKPPLGGNPDGSSGGLDYAELCESCDNRTDELRLLGNGVVPASAADAFVRGLNELLT